MSFRATRGSRQQCHWSSHTQMLWDPFELLGQLSQTRQLEHRCSDVDLHACRGPPSDPRAPLHHVAYKLQGPKSCNLSPGGLMPRARDSAAMHHLKPAASAPALR